MVGSRDRSRSSRRELWSPPQPTTRHRRGSLGRSRHDDEPTAWLSGANLAIENGYDETEDYEGDARHEEETETRGHGQEPGTRDPNPRHLPPQQRYRKAVDDLSDDVHNYVQSEYQVVSMASLSADNFTDAQTGRTRNVIRQAEAIVATGVARHVPSCTQGSSEWASVLELYRSAVLYLEKHTETPGTRAESSEDKDSLAMYPGKEKQDDLQKVGYMTIRGDYRRAALDALSKLWRHKVPNTSLPSYRLWGIVLRYKWLYNEFQPLDFWQLQSAQQGKLVQPQTGERGQLGEDTRLSVPQPGTTDTSKKP